MEKLRRLEISRGYVALLKDADGLRYLSLTGSSTMVAKRHIAKMR